MFKNVYFRFIYKIKNLKIIKFKQYDRKIIWKS